MNRLDELARDYQPDPVEKAVRWLEERDRIAEKGSIPAAQVPPEAVERAVEGAGPSVTAAMREIEA